MDKKNKYRKSDLNPFDLNENGGFNRIKRYTPNQSIYLLFKLIENGK